jgi:hypothetical protein
VLKSAENLPVRGRKIEKKHYFGLREKKEIPVFFKFTLLEIVGRGFNHKTIKVKRHFYFYFNFA